MKIPLNPPFKYEDYELSELDLDLAGKLTSRMMEACEAEFRRVKGLGEIVPVPSLDSRFRLIVASKVLKLPKEVLTALPFEPYSIIHNSISYFLVNSQEPSMETAPELENADL